MRSFWLAWECRPKPPCIYSAKPRELFTEQTWALGILIGYVSSNWSLSQPDGFSGHQIFTGTVRLIRVSPLGSAFVTSLSFGFQTILIHNIVIFIKSISFVNASFITDNFVDALSVPFALLNAVNSKKILAPVIDAFHLRIATTRLAAHVTTEHELDSRADIPSIVACTLPASFAVPLCCQHFLLRRMQDYIMPYANIIQLLSS